MVRPRKCRRVDALPHVTYFKPRGVPLNELSETRLSVEGLEALRLVDHQGLNYEEAAAQMQVSRQTLGRIVAQARQRVAGALVSGFALRIRGGHYAFSDERRSKSSPPVTPIKEKEGAMQKIAISSQGATMDDGLDPRFGRAAGFIIVDPETLEWNYLDNAAGRARGQGAGIQAAETVASAGVKAVLTGYVGPKAFRALRAAGIQVGQNMENMTVRQAIEAYINNQVNWSPQPNGKGRFDEGRNRQRQRRNG